MSTRHSEFVRAELVRVDLGEVPYDEAEQAMKGWAEERRSGLAPDRIFFLSHPPVITCGPRTDPADLQRLTDTGNTIEVRTVDRGGYATYHGPGQLIGYLVVDLKTRGPVDVVRWVEHALVDALATFGLIVHRRETPKGESSLVGVWTQDNAKIASIGMRISRSITTHGFALNIDPDLSVFDNFVVCGLGDVTMTSVRELAERSGVPLPATEQIVDAIYAQLAK